MSSLLALAAIFLVPFIFAQLINRAYTMKFGGLETQANETLSFWENRKVVAALAISLAVSGWIYLLFTLAVTFLSYGLPPCDSDAPVFWARLGCSGGLIVGSMLLFLPRVSAKFRFALTAGVPALLFGVQQFVIIDNVQRQAACAARSLTEAMTVCGAEQTHYRRGATSRGSATLTLVTPGTTDHAWNCLVRWSYHAQAAPSLQIDESVYAAARVQPKASDNR